jgi:membrane-bound serine protease (ClpP class)
MKTFRIAFSLIVLLSAPVMGDQGRIRLVAIDGPVTPVTAEYIGKNIKESAARGDRLFLVEMDTPGGLDSSMRRIVKDILASPVPVAVHVSPSGARAASAGAVIAMAAHVCVMAPGTNIGAAHPVALGSGQDKVMQEKTLNDMEAYVEGIAEKRGRNGDVAKKMVRSSISLSAEKALEAKVIDYMATDRTDLLRKLEGRSVRTDSSVQVLRLAGVPVERHEMGTREKILDTIGNPNIAYVLMMLGFLGLFFELSNPGVILPGVIGGISLILAFFAFQTLPVNYAGVLLIIFALVLFIAEIKIVSHGMLTVGGMLAMILGSLMLYESSDQYFRVSWSVILATVILVTGFACIVIRKAIRAHKRKPSSGREGLLGERGVADSDIDPEGKVFVRGEYWDAWSDETIRKGEGIMVQELEGMKLKVKKITTHQV